MSGVMTDLGSPPETGASAVEPPRIAYIVRSWPRLSQTFILNEVLALERLGCELSIFALCWSGESLVQEEVAHVRAPVGSLRAARARDHAVVAGAAARPYARSLIMARRRPELAAGYSTSSTAACFAQAVSLAAAIERERRRGRPIGHLHAHFAHDPALVALFTHRLTGVPFSFTAHARDLYGVPAGALAARAQEASAIVTCCQANAAHLRAVLPEPVRARVHLVHHGVDLDTFTAAPRPLRSEVPLVLSVGRLVEKKGFPDLIRACAKLKSTGRRFRCAVHGNGPQREELVRLRDGLGLAADVTFAGEHSQRELVSEFQRADVFALTPHVTDDGDRDGVPNVVAEAMACAVPVVSTSVGGVPDLVRHGVNGLLAAPHDVDAIAGHLAALLVDAPRRRLLGRAARRTVEETFDLRASARQLARLFAGEEHMS
jgi:glycosyltransferase involved in cell wall biosynthesis